jgi:hypothetical protein
VTVVELQQRSADGRLHRDLIRPAPVHDRARGVFLELVAQPVGAGLQQVGHLVLRPIPSSNWKEISGRTSLKELRPELEREQIGIKQLAISTV